MIRDILKTIISFLTGLISSHPFISSIIFIALGVYIIKYKIPQIKPFFDDKDSGYYRELFFYVGLVIFLFIYAIVLLLKNL